MPKNRGSNTIANSGNRSSRSSGSNNIESSAGGGGGIGGGSGGGSGTLPEIEMADRLENRLNEIRTVPVDVVSRTRGGTERVEVTFDPNNPGHATVSSESGNTYHVDHENGTCDCMHFIHRNARCRHIEATDIARGRLNDEVAIGDDRTGQIASEEAISSRMTADNYDEERRRALSGEEVDDNYFYSDNPEDFQRDMERLAAEPLPFDYNNVLNGSNATFGIELEFADGDSDAIAEELYEAGICSHPYMLPYRSRATPGKWKLERDGSVTSGGRGGELVSPVLRDTPECWKAIEKVCEVAKRHGARVNMRTGGHVHVGMDALDTARQRWKRFFKAIAGNEDTIYRFAGGELGQYRRNPSTDYAPPFIDNARRGAAMRRPINTIDDVNNMANDISQRNRYYGVNLTNIPQFNRPNTVEFRYFNGSLSPGQIQANIKLAVGIINTAEKARTRDSEGITVTDNQKRRGAILNEMESSRSNEAMMKFVDTFFTRKKDKEHIIGVLGKNIWRW